MASGVGERICELLPCTVSMPLLSVECVTLLGISATSLAVFSTHTRSAVGSFLLLVLSLGPFIP